MVVGSEAIDTVVTGTARRERREMGRDRGSEKVVGERFIRGDGRSRGRGDGRRRGVRLKEIEGERGEMGRVGGRRMGGDGKRYENQKRREIERKLTRLSVCRLSTANVQTHELPPPPSD